MTWVPVVTGKLQCEAPQRSESNRDVGACGSSEAERAALGLQPAELLPVVRKAAPGAESLLSAIQSGPLSVAATAEPPASTRYRTLVFAAVGSAPAR